MMYPGIIELVLLLGLGGGGLPLGVPPAPEDPMMARVAPEQCVFYTTWSAMAEPDAASKNQLEQLLAEPEIRQFATELEKQIMASIHQAVKEEEPSAVPLVDDVAGWVKKLLTHSTAVFISDLKIARRGPEIRGGMLVHVGPDVAKLKESLQTYQSGFLRDQVEEVEIEGATWYRLKLDRDAPVITWGVKDEYLVVGLGEGNAEKILARMATPMPQWLADIRRQVPVERTSNLSYVNLKLDVLQKMGIPISEEVAQQVGFANLTALISVSGLDDEGFVNRTLLAIDGSPQGLFGSIVDGRLGPEDLGPIPADATVAAAARIDIAKVFDAWMAALEQIDERGHESFQRGFEQMGKSLKLDLRKGIIESLGDTWRVYNSPGEGGFLVTGLTAVVDVKDRGRLGLSHGMLVAMFRAQFGQSTSRRTPRIEQFTFAGQEVYFFDSRDDDFLLAPAWCLTDKELIVSTTPQNIKAYLSRGEDFKSLATVPRAADALSSPAGPVAIGYCDTRKVFDVVYPFVPMVAQAIFANLHRDGIDLKVSMLPSYPAIRKHLRPSTCTLRKTGAGIEVIRRQTLPMGPSVILGPMSFSWMMFARMSHAHHAEFQATEIGAGQLRMEKVRPVADKPETPR
ncbi:MAG: hypothetical protein JW888_07570 [Pirellulales bacterium]|nr:hypothetical protein [Pirellulales bacterium]